MFTVAILIFLASSATGAAYILAFESGSRSMRPTEHGDGNPVRIWARAAVLTAAVQAVLWGAVALQMAGAL